MLKSNGIKFLVLLLFLKSDLFKKSCYVVSVILSNVNIRSPSFLK